MNGFSIRDVISSAWKNLKGTKWPIGAVILVGIIVLLGIGVLTSLLLIGIPALVESGRFGATPGVLAPPFNPFVFFTAIAIIYIIMMFVAASVITGVQMTALKKARGEAISAKSGFQYLHKWFFLGVTLIYYLIAVFVIAGIYSLLLIFIGKVGITWLSYIVQSPSYLLGPIVYTFFMFNLLFVADKDKGPFTALLCSAKAVAPHWFKVFLLVLFMNLVFILSLLPLGLGLLCPLVWVKVLGGIVSVVLLIWTIPYIQLLLATAYNKLSQQSRQ